MTIAKTKKLLIDWGALVTQRPTLQQLHDLTEGKAGVLLLRTDGTVDFVKEHDLETAATETGAEPDLMELAGQYAVAKKIPHGYDPRKDVVVCFRGDDGPLERLTSRQTVRSRAWLVKPVSRSVRRINLAEPEAVVAHLAFEM